MPNVQIRWVRLRTQLTAQFHRAQTTLPMQVTAWRTQLATLRTSARWRALWRFALPLLAYAVAWTVALHVADVLQFVISPKVEYPFPLYLTGPVTVSALLLTPPRRRWLA